MTAGRVTAYSRVAEGPTEVGVQRRPRSAPAAGFFPYAAGSPCAPCAGARLIHGPFRRSPTTKEAPYGEGEQVRRHCRADGEVPFSNAAVLTEYRGLTVKQLTSLRTTLRGNATYAVVKNTLTDIAARDAGVTAFDGSLAGPTAIAFIEGDVVECSEGPA